jgi:ribosome-binding factor A
MSADMGIAYIYLSVYNTLYKQEIIKEIWENLARLRGELGKRIRKQVRRIPMLKFFIDDTLDEVEHLDMLFNAINNPGSSEMSMKEAMELRSSKTEGDDEAEEEDKDIDEEE